MSIIMQGIAVLFVGLISLGIICGILYFVVKAAVAAGIKDAMWNLEVKVSMRNAVKGGVAEALQEAEAKKSETEQNHG